MNDGVKILLERMKTHPEEFVEGIQTKHTKWGRLIEYYEHVLTDEEKQALKDNVRELVRQDFTAKVLEMLMDDSNPVVKEDWWNRYNNPPTTIGTPVYTTSTSLSQLQEEVLKKKEKEVEELVMKEYWKALAKEEIENETKSKKNKSKMEQLLQRVTGSKY